MVPGERDELEAEEPELAPIAAERVRAIVAAAEEAAAAIVADAEAEAERVRAAAAAEADRIRAAARTESEEKVEAASREASGRIEQARGAVEGLVSQADRLRAQVGALGRDLAASVPGAPGRGAGENAAPPVADERRGEPPAIPEEPAPEREEPEAAGAPSTEDLIAQLRGPSTATEGAGAASPSPGADQGAARLVAMNMALEGAPRDEIAKQIEADFGPLAGVEALLDDVLDRAGR